jgi:signal transduction histidine kinase
MTLALIDIERAGARQQFLADAVALLASSLDYNTTLTSLANLAVPRIADWCSIDMLNENGSISTLAVAHVDPAKIEFARRLQERFPPDPLGQHGVSHVIRTGESELVREIDEVLLRQAIPDEEFLAIIRELGLRSSMMVPLKARGQMLGVLTLIAAESGHLFDADDLSLAEELASRAALTIDNARLYRQAQRVAAEQTAVMERITDGLVIVNTAEEITFMNDMGRRFFGSGLVGQSVDTAARQVQTFTWEGRPHEPGDLPSRRALHGETVVDLEWKVMLPDVGAMYLQGSASPVDAEDGTRIGAVIAFRDVTERKRADDELRRLGAELEQRVVERTIELESANKELESFAYSVSHDLRAPLRSMDGFSQVLVERYADKFDERGTRYLNHIRDAAQEMGGLIDALLQLSRVTRGEMQRERVDLTPLTQSIGEQLRKMDPGRDVTLGIANGLVTTGDAQLLRIMLENLIGNAWKFSRQNLNTYIEFGLIRQDRIPIFFVRDNGAGFDMTYENKLFTPFQRLHAASDFEGTGIGLATVQRIVRRHGGRIWAESTVGQGSTFYFTLQPDQQGAA